MKEHSTYGDKSFNQSHSLQIHLGISFRVHKCFVSKTKLTCIYFLFPLTNIY